MSYRQQPSPILTPYFGYLVKGAGASVVDLGGPYSPMIHTLHARDPDVGEQVYVVDPLSWTEVAEETAYDAVRLAG
jgi:hypothetical protein